MSIGTYLRPNIHQNGPEILGVNTCFQQKFTTGSFKVGIGCAWYSWETCEICSSLVQKKRLKKKYFSSHKLPKQQSTSFWSQGTLGVNTIVKFNMHMPLN
jgi:hypothetical protein